MSDLPDLADDELDSVREPSLWSQNHGNFLLYWIAGILLVGTIVLWVRSGNDTNRVVAEDFGLPVQIEEPTLIVRVIGKENLPAGDMKIAIYETADSFRDPTRAALKDSISHVDGVAVWLVPMNLLPTKFGIAAYHDSDGDGKLTKNQLGMPIEPFGFSRNVRGIFGSPPDFKDTLIERNTETFQTEIQIR